MEKHYYRSLIDTYAVRYGLDPNEHVWHMSFSDIFVFLELIHDNAEYADRFRAAEKMLNPSQ